MVSTTNWEVIFLTGQLARFLWPGIKTFALVRQLNSTFRHTNRLAQLTNIPVSMGETLSLELGKDNLKTNQHNLIPNSPVGKLVRPTNWHVVFDTFNSLTSGPPRIGAFGCLR